jgi:hypothetical protein
MAAHLRHPTQTRAYAFERGRLAVTLCGKTVTSNPYVLAVDIEDHIAPPRHFAWRLEQKAYRRCIRCLKVLAAGVLYLEPETGATVLVKNPPAPAGKRRAR